MVPVATPGLAFNIPAASAAAAFPSDGKKVKKNTEKGKEKVQFFIGAECAR